MMSAMMCTGGRKNNYWMWSNLINMRNIQFPRGKRLLFCLLSWLPSRDGAKPLLHINFLLYFIMLKFELISYIQNHSNQKTIKIVNNNKDVFYCSLFFYCHTKVKNNFFLKWLLKAVQCLSYSESNVLHIEPLLWWCWRNRWRVQKAVTPTLTHGRSSDPS